MAAPLKVLYLLHDSRRSGVPAVVSHLVRSLDRSRIEPELLFAYDGIYAEELRTAGFAVTTFGPRHPFLWRVNRFLFVFWLMARVRQYDIVHVHSMKLAFAVIAAKMLGARVIFHLHELPRRIPGLLRQAMAAADCVVYCSRTCAAHFAGIPTKQSRTIVNGLRFSDIPPARHEGTGRKIVATASLNRNKGQDLLLRAFARLRDRRAELWLYGTTGLSAHGFVRRLKEFAREQGLEERVFFPGPTTDVLGVFSEASVMVHPSLSESFGMALVEAMSCGVPVIGHDLEGMREVVVDGVTGFLVKPGDVESLAQRLDELLADAALRQRLGEAGYALVRERFDIGVRVGAYMELYEELCPR